MAKQALRTNFLLLAGSVLLSLVLAEIAASRFPPGEASRNDHKLLCEYDPLLGWRKIPNASAVYRTAEYSTAEHINSRGIRGPEYPYSKGKGEYRVLILGDSFAEGYSVGFNDLFSEVLKDRLRAKGVNCQVINSGTGGYSTDQELLFYQSEGRKYDPDLVVLMFYENDVWFNSRSKYWSGSKPVFKDVNGRLALSNVPVPPPGAAGEKTWLGGLKNALYSRSYLYRLLSGLINGPGRSALRRRGETAGVPEEFAPWRKTADPAVDEAWKITELLIRKLRGAARADKSGLLVFLCPSRASVYPGVWASTKKEYALPDGAWSPGQPALRLKAICGRNRIEFLDPTPAFAAEAAGPRHEALYYASDGHWNRAGNKLAGDILAGRVYSGVIIKNKNRAAGYKTGETR